MNAVIGDNDDTKYELTNEQTLNDMQRSLENQISTFQDTNDENTTIEMTHISVEALNIPVDSAGDRITYEIRSRIPKGRVSSESPSGEEDAAISFPWKIITELTISGKSKSLLWFLLFNLLLITKCGLLVVARNY